MGHLLGAASALARSGLMPAPHTVRRTQHVTEFTRNAGALPHLAGFAIDTPEPDLRYPGGGVEINGWALGLSAPVVSVVTTVDDGLEIASPLDVRRPDVLADYPTFPWASGSGFSFWVPLPHDSVTWSIEVEALLASGARIALARLSGQQIDQTLASRADTRLVTAPDYIILGTQRGGTTSLFRYLGAHPDVCNPGRKEMHFLTDRYNRGVAWYLGQLPGTLSSGNLTGEATPYALFHPRAPARASEIAPRAKFIVLLRDPVARAFSHYQHERTLGVEPLSIVKALAAESSRIAGEFERLSTDSSYVSFNHKHYSYLARGDYAAQLARWLNHFPRDQFLILKSEELYEDPRTTMQRVCHFLELPDVELGPFEAHNRSTPESRDQALLAVLREHFAPINEGLSRLVDWPHTWP